MLNPYYSSCFLLNSSLINLGLVVSRFVYFVEKIRKAKSIKCRIEIHSDKFVCDSQIVNYVSGSSIRTVDTVKPGAKMYRHTIFL